MNQYLNNKKGVSRFVGRKRLLFVLTLVVLLSLTWHYYKSGAFDPILIEQYKAQHPILAVLLFLAIYAISVITALPSLPLNLAAGFFWGGVLGGIYSAVGVTLGGLISFLIARWAIGQPLADKFGNQWFSKVQSEFARNGWKFVAFARVNPIIPTGPLNYLLGLTSLSTFSFLWVSFVFLLPPSILVAYIGDTMQTFVAHEAEVKMVIRAILVVSAVFTALVAIKYASNIYKKRMEKQ